MIWNDDMQNVCNQQIAAHKLEFQLQIFQTDNHLFANLLVK